MGSKKHKKESKKKKHRSRSRSPLEGEERERKRHRKHKDRKKDRSPDVEEVPVDSHLVPKETPQSRSRSSSLTRSQKDLNSHDDKHSDKSHEAERSQSPVAVPSSAQESLSIEETNKLRAKLGLKPLEVAEKAPAEDGKLKDDLGEFYHKPAPNLSQQKKADKIRERLEERKEKRKLETKLKTNLLAEGSDDEDASAWVKKSRQLDKQKKEAEKRAAVLDEMDEAFGVGALLAEEQRERRRRSYGARHLRGLRVAHDAAALPDERETVLTLADREVLAEDEEDVLVNVNMVDDERYRKNIEERRKAAAGYQAYDAEAEEAAALGLPRPLLAQYDDAPARPGFLLGDAAALRPSRLELLRQERLSGPDKRLESLQLPQPRIASDYMDEHEISTKFKKIKKKGKSRKKPKQEPIDVEDYEAGGAPLDTDDTDVKVEELVVDEEEVEVDGELQSALARARRLRLAAPPPAPPAPPLAPLAPPRGNEVMDESLEKVKKEEESDEEPEGGGMVLDATAEFCRTLGDIPTYGLAGNRDSATEIMDFEREQAEAEPEVEEESGAWSRVDLGSERPPDLVAGSSVGLAAEPALGAGVAGALQLALSKGYLERAGAAPAPRAQAQHLQQLQHLLNAHNYSIEDKTYGEDDKHGRRERGHHGGGAVSEFREKASFRPNVKLEYVDDDGHALCPKEAFRYLSHKFHGKGPGKNKQEKRIKKAVQEGLMKKMSSTDTPLGTLHMLQQKQRETRSPYVLLSGARGPAAERP